MNKKLVLVLVVITALIALAVAAVILSRDQREESQVVVGEPIQSQPLSSDKEAIKNRLVAPLGGAGILTENEDFRVEYYSPDFFQAVIKTTAVADARDKAINWFKEQGFTEEDICKLPITFSLTPEVDQKLMGSGFSYGALPDFCL